VDVIVSEDKIYVFLYVKIDNADEKVPQIPVLSGSAKQARSRNVIGVNEIISERCKMGLFQ
jgi:hypothetical protein